MTKKWLAGLLALSLVLFLVGTAPAAAPAPPAGGQPAGLSSEFTHLLFGVKDGQLKVFHLVKLKNAGQAKSGPIEISLPKGYENLKFSGDTDGTMAKEVKIEAESISDPRGLEPGAARDYAVTYDLPMPLDGLSLSVKVNHPTQMILILADQGTVQMLPLQNRDFRSEGSAEYGKKTFDQFARNDVAPGTALTMTLGSAARTSHEASPPGQVTQGTIALLNQAFHGGASNMMLWQRFTGNAGHGGLVGMIIILTALTGLIFGVGRTWYIRSLINRGLDPSTGERIEETLEKLLKEKGIYIKKIADLDRRLEAGKISPEDHGERRSAYKRRLVKVMARLKEMET